MRSFRRYREYRAAASEWPVYERNLIAWAEANAEDYDEEKHIIENKKEEDA